MTRSSQFLRTLHERAPLFAKHVEATAAAMGESFSRRAEQVLGWADAALGDETDARLVDGYTAFVMDVNRAQIAYERDGHYRYASYAEIKRAVYDDDDFMRDYHWGMYATLFCWKHHLQLTDFFAQHFVGDLHPNSALLDLGCGSGVWSMMALDALPKANATLVDITPSVVERTHSMLQATGFANRAHVVQGDATSFRPDAPIDAIISCFVAAHLEQPQRYFETIAALLPPQGKAFVIVALTAAESDHIYEFKDEQEAISMVTASGLTVTESLCTSPGGKPGTQKIPRALALIVQNPKS